MLQGQKAFFIEDAAIKSAAVTLSNDDETLLLYTDGEHTRSLTRPTQQVYLTDRDAVSAFIRLHGSFPFQNQTALTFEMEIEPEPALVGV